MTAARLKMRTAIETIDHWIIPCQLNSANTAIMVSTVLAAGGDMRIWPDPSSGRNRYGTCTSPAPDEISFSSTTASTITPEGFAAAGHALGRLFGAASDTATHPEHWFDEIRSGIERHLTPAGSEAILAASGTDAEILTLGIVTQLSKQPLTNIFIAPDETGNGIPLAAAGRHFSNMTALGESVAAGQGIDGISPERIDVKTIAIRDAAGAPRRPEAIDQDAVLLVEQELRRGRDVLLHVLDTSKTGLAGVTRPAARHVASLAPGRVRIVIDACQLRCSFAQIHRDLCDGFLVTVTGSKFIAGPPFAGALLLPSQIVDELAVRGALPVGLSDYTAAFDWPLTLRDRLGITFKSDANIGLGLRWVAALDSMTALAAISEPTQSLIVNHMSRQVRSLANEARSRILHDDDAHNEMMSPSIVPLTVLDGNGGFAPLEDAQRVQVGLRNATGGQISHIGQPVRVGPRTVLRMGLSARDVVSVARRMAAGLPLDEASQSIAADLDALFAKWSRISRNRDAD